MNSSPPSVTDGFSVLLVDTSHEGLYDMESAVLQHYPNAALHYAHSLTAAKDMMLEQNPHCVMLTKATVTEGNAVKPELIHGLQHTVPDIPIILCTNQCDTAEVTDFIRHGLQDALTHEQLHSPYLPHAIQCAVARKESEKDLIKLANYDMLTGLANRLRFETALDMALARMGRRESMIGVLFLDLDGFKAVNDTHGHAFGDALLKEVGNRMKRALRACDLVARFGGDEFAILLEGLNEVHHTQLVAQKIIRLFSKPFHVIDEPIAIGVSIGISCCAETSDKSREELMLQADRAMYSAKLVSGSAYHFYHKEQTGLQPA